MKLTGISKQELEIFLKLIDVAEEIDLNDLQMLYDHMIANSITEISGDYGDNGMEMDQDLANLANLYVYYTALTLLAGLVDREGYGSIQIPVKSVGKFIRWWNKELRVTIGDE